MPTPPTPHHRPRPVTLALSQFSAAVTSLAATRALDMATRGSVYHPTVRDAVAYVQAVVELDSGSPRPEGSMIVGTAIALLIEAGLSPSRLEEIVGILAEEGL